MRTRRGRYGVELVGMGSGLDFHVADERTMAPGECHLIPAFFGSPITHSTRAPR